MKHGRAQTSPLHRCLTVGLEKASEDRMQPMRDDSELVATPIEPSVDGAFSDDGVDLTLIRWMLEQSPTERLQAAQDLIDATWQPRAESET